MGIWNQLYEECSLSFLYSLLDITLNIYTLKHAQWRGDSWRSNKWLLDWIQVSLINALSRPSWVLKNHYIVCRTRQNHSECHSGMKRPLIFSPCCNVRFDFPILVRIKEEASKKNAAEAWFDFLMNRLITLKYNQIIERSELYSY